MPGTVKLHRVLRAPAARVHRAFLDAGALVKWLPPNGCTGTAPVTIALTPVSCGTELAVVQEGIPDLIPTGQC